MAKLNDYWWHTFRGGFETEEDVIEFIYERFDTKGFEESYIDMAGSGEPNEMFKLTAEDKRQIFYEFLYSLVGDKK